MTTAHDAAVTPSAVETIENLLGDGGALDNLATLVPIRKRSARATNPKCTHVRV